MEVKVDGSGHVLRDGSPKFWQQQYQAPFSNPCYLQFH
jgi:hypothetical protein